MIISRVIDLATEYDIAHARLQVRALARQLGMDQTAQTRLALAAASLAERLGIGSNGQVAQMQMETIAERDRQGLRLWVTCYSPLQPFTDTELLSGITWMVDEIEVNDLGHDQIEITLLKWVMP